MEERERMITLQCRLKFETREVEREALSLMRIFSSCIRYAYNRLLEGKGRKELKKHLQLIFPLNSRYCDDAILKAKEVLNTRIEAGQNPRKVVFGGRKLFEQLRKKHLTGKRKAKLKEEWLEKRQGIAYSRGDKSKKGNLNLRSVCINGKLFLRINTGKGEYVYAKVHRKVQKGRKR